MLQVNSNGELMHFCPNSGNTVLADSKIFLSEVDKRKITIGSKTNNGIVENLTMNGNWVVKGEVIGRWRDVVEVDGKFYFC